MSVVVGDGVVAVLVVVGGGSNVVVCFPEVCNGTGRIPGLICFHEEKKSMDSFS